MPASSDDEIEYIPITVLQVQEGDRVLVAMKEMPSDTDGTRMVKALRERFPGVEFTLVTGVEGIAVQNDQ